MFANIVSLAGSIATGFLLPKLFSLDDYGYFKIFSLYLTYTGILHFGFPDGFLLKNSGISYENLEKKDLRTISLFFIFFQLFISLIIMIAATGAKGEYRYIFTILGLSTFSVNAITFFQFISQASMRFNEFSRVKIATSLMNLGIVAVLYVARNLSDKIYGYRFYLILYTFVNWCILLYYIWKYRECFIGEKSPWKLTKGQVFEYFKAGIFLTISYQILQIVLNLDRQFVSVLFNTSEYAIYSFAYSLISMVTTVISAISLVLFPALKSIEKKTAIAFFPMGLLGVEGLVMLCLGGYFPLAKIIEIFLPKYLHSLSYLQILFPSLIFSSCITLIIFTYYKILDYNSQFFIIGMGILVVSFLLNLLFYIIYKTPEAISFASIITLTIWFIITMSFLKKHQRIVYGKNLIYIICISICFYAIVYHVENLVVGFVLYEIGFVFLLTVFYGKDVRRLLKEGLRFEN